VRKVTLAAIEEARRLARNPQIGAFRVHAALKQKGFDLSRATCGRILARVREIYGYENPRAAAAPRSRCLSPPSATTSSGPPMSATWTCSTRSCWQMAWSTP